MIKYTGLQNLIKIATKISQKISIQLKKICQTSQPFGPLNNPIFV